jgi:uncharacterized protein
MTTEQRMKEFIKQLLNNSVCRHYAYHNLHHTLYVYEQAIEIARHEQVSEKDLFLIKTAALWHDTGYINQYTGHEEESCHLAKQQLPQFGLTESDIAAVCGMIMATRIPQTAHTLPEQIVADADLVYLGNGEAAIQSTYLYEELHQINPALTTGQWNHLQVSFIQKHRFFTRYCQQTKEAVKQSYLNQLKKEIQ